MLSIAAECPARRDDRLRRDTKRIGRRDKIRFAGRYKIDQCCKNAGIAGAGPQIVSRKAGQRKEAAAKVVISDDIGQQLQAGNERVRDVVKALVASHVYATPVACTPN